MEKSDNTSKNKDTDLIEWLVQIDIVKRMEFFYYVEYKTTIKKFLEKHSLPESLSIPVSGVFFATSLPDEVPKAFVKYRDYGLKAEWLQRVLTLERIKSDKTLKRWFKIEDNERIDKFIEECKRISNLTHPYVNEKTFLFSKLDHVFYDMHKLGIGQTEQINIVYDLFRQQKFEDYHFDSYTKEKKDRIRKMQEKIINKMKLIYGTKST